MDRNVGSIIVTYELLSDLLHIPKDHKIISVYSKQDRPFMFLVTIEGVDMPLIWEGAIVPYLDRLPQKWLEKKEEI